MWDYLYNLVAYMPHLLNFVQAQPNWLAALPYHNRRTMEKISSFDMRDMRYICRFRKPDCQKPRDISYIHQVEERFKIYKSKSLMSKAEVQGRILENYFSNWRVGSILL